MMNDRKYLQNELSEMRTELKEIEGKLNGVDTTEEKNSTIKLIVSKEYLEENIRQIEMILFLNK